MKTASCAAAGHTGAMRDRQKAYAAADTVAVTKRSSQSNSLTSEVLVRSAPRNFAVRRSTRGRAVDNLPDGAQVFSLSPLRKPFTKEVKEIRQSARLRKKKRVDYSKF